MIFWSGYGIVVALIGFFTLIMTEFISEYIADDRSFYQENSWVIFIGMIISAVITYGFNKLLQKEKSKIVIDKVTGEEFELRKSHSLFFINIKYWPILYILIGFAFLFFR